MVDKAASWRTAGGARRALLGAWLGLGIALFPVAAQAEDVAPARGDLSVTDAVRVALAHNPDLGVTKEGVRSAAGARNLARQNYLPRLGATYNLSRSYNSTPHFDTGSGTFTSSANTYSTRYTLSQNIFDIPSLLGISAAGKDLAGSKAEYAFSRSDLVLTVKQQYYALLAAQLLAAVDDSALALSQRELDRTQSLFELGMVAKSDVLKQQVQVASSRLSVISSHGDVVNQRARLASLLGQDPTDDLRASDQLGETPVAIDSVQMYADALANRGDLRSSKLAWDAASTRSRAAKAGFVPTLGATFLYSNSNPNGVVPFSSFVPRAVYDSTGSTIIGSTNPTRGVSVSLSVPFFDGIVGRKGTIQEAAARSEQARYAYEKKRLDLEVELRSTINAARQANEGIEVAKSGLESAQEDLKLSQEKYNVGSGTILDLLDAQVNLQKAQQQYVLALTQARVAEAQIERARGIVP